MIDFIPSLFVVPVPQYSIFPLFGPKAATAAVNTFFLTAEQLRRHCHIVAPDGMTFTVCTIPASLSTPMYAL